MSSERHKPILIMGVCTFFFFELIFIMRAANEKLLALITDQRCVSLPIDFEGLTPNSRSITFKPSSILFWFGLDPQKRLETS